MAAAGVETAVAAETCPGLRGLGLRLTWRRQGLQPSGAG